MCKELCQAIKDAKWLVPTKIQREAIPVSLSGFYGISLFIIFYVYVFVFFILIFYIISIVFLCYWGVIILLKYIAVCFEIVAHKEKLMLCMLILFFLMHLSQSWLCTIVSCYYCKRQFFLCSYFFCFFFVSIGKDIIGLAETGSGKTGAFTIPILQDMLDCQPQGFFALVLSPTRELAMQIQEQFQMLGQVIGVKCGWYLILYDLLY